MGTADVYHLAEACLKEEKEVAAFRSLIYGDKKKQIMTINLLRENGTLVTERINGSAYFSDLVVTVNGKWYHIFSKEAKAFRKQCFIERNWDVTTETSTHAYILDSFHNRNWDIVTKTDRFKLPVVLCDK